VLRICDILVQIRIQEAQKHTDPDPGPQHWLSVWFQEYIVPKI
jgi:hypothetical protein